MSSSSDVCAFAFVYNPICSIVENCYLAQKFQMTHPILPIFPPHNLGCLFLCCGKRLCFAFEELFAYFEVLFMKFFSMDKFLFYSKSEENVRKPPAVISID